MAISGCVSWYGCHCSMSVGLVTVPGVLETISIPKSIFSQVSPMTSLRSFMRCA